MVLGWTRGVVFCWGLGVSAEGCASLGGWAAVLEVVLLVRGCATCAAVIAAVRSPPSVRQAP